MLIYNNTHYSNGWLTKAVLDVFEEEPVPVTSPLWHHPKVIMSPHSACLDKNVVERVSNLCDTSTYNIIYILLKCDQLGLVMYVSYVHFINLLTLRSL